MNTNNGENEKKETEMPTTQTQPPQTANRMPIIDLQEQTFTIESRSIPYQQLNDIPQPSSPVRYQIITQNVTENVSIKSPQSKQPESVADSARAKKQSNENNLNEKINQLSEYASTLLKLQKHISSAKNIEKCAPPHSPPDSRTQIFDRMQQMLEQLVTQMQQQQHKSQMSEHDDNQLSASNKQFAAISPAEVADNLVTNETTAKTTETKPETISTTSAKPESELKPLEEIKKTQAAAAAAKTTSPKSPKTKKVAKKESGEPKSKTPTKPKSLPNDQPKSKIDAPPDSENLFQLKKVQAKVQSKKKHSETPTDEIAPDDFVHLFSEQKNKKTKKQVMIESRAKMIAKQKQQQQQQQKQKQQQQQQKPNQAGELMQKKQSFLQDKKIITKDKKN